ncbi:four helix bundle protein [Actomonas aquatica]|uniref:Four helix bundle protein n=1 Tax=Actomonas aquatica TaxID=2866162 RepID=A0ABZ1CBJ0_9BACT|nr:four helix bundle protein [Opitutus sp. WL0086]WRQ88863.1 four helix bundle protein [Opitutus sp. WL0086]
MKEPEDLGPRTERFAREVRAFVKMLPCTVSNREDVKQLVRASGSVAANYIEADDALGPKDKLMRFRICRKEAKESRLWLSLVDVGTAEPLAIERARLVDEAMQFVSIFSAIINRLGR